jgi:lysophospholipase L1-like esterase
MRSKIWLLFYFSTALVLLGCGGGSGSSSSSSSTTTTSNLQLQAPAGIEVHAGYPAVTLTWDAVDGAEKYNLYVATEPGISPANWSLLSDGEALLGVTSPYEHRRLYKDVTYYYVVTAEKDGIESASSSEVHDDNQYIFDDFERPDQVLAGTAPTGQAWAASGPGIYTYGIVGGRMVSSQNVYSWLPYVYHNFRFGADFSFINSSGNSSCVLISSGDPDQPALRNMVHLQLGKAGWGLIYRADIHNVFTAEPNQTVFDYTSSISNSYDLLVYVDGEKKLLDIDYVISGVGNPNGGTVTFNQPFMGGEIIQTYAPGLFENIMGDKYTLNADGTVYSASMTIMNNTVTVDLPDGTRKKAIDSRIQSITGKDLIWQLTGDGCRNEAVYATPVTNTTSTALIDALGHAPKIMALGDSITTGCCNPTVGYYQFLADDLIASDYQFSMVGSVSAGGYNIEGHPGAWPSDLLSGILDSTSGLRSGGIASWMVQSTPDVVLLHAGTNGVMPSTLSYDPATARWGSQVADMRSLLDGIFNGNQNAYVILAEIINTQTPSSDITEYNRQLALMASTYGNSHLFLVNMGNILAGDPQANYVDAVHPSAAGLKIMADRWYQALTPILNGTTSDVQILP